MRRKQLLVNRCDLGSQYRSQRGLSEIKGGRQPDLFDLKTGRGKLAGKCLSVEAQKLRRTPLVPADNLEDLEDVAPIDLLAISRRRFLSRLPTPKSRVSWIVVSVRSARPSLWYCLMRERL